MHILNRVFLIYALELRKLGFASFLFFSLQNQREIANCKSMCLKYEHTHTYLLWFFIFSIYLTNIFYLPDQSRWYHSFRPNFFFFSFAIYIYIYIFTFMNFYQKPGRILKGKFKHLYRHWWSPGALSVIRDNLFLAKWKIIPNGH